MSGYDINALLSLLILIVGFFLQAFYKQVQTMAKDVAEMKARESANSVRIDVIEQKLDQLKPALK